MNYGMRFVTGDRDQDHPHGKEMKKSKMAVWGGLTNSCEKKRDEIQLHRTEHRHTCPVRETKQCTGPTPPTGCRIHN